MKQAKPWTDAHIREANARLLELAAELFRSGQDRAPWYLTTVAESCSSERRLRVLLGSDEEDPDPCFDAARVNREVRCVRALAEGRLVREVSWNVNGVSMADEAEARAVSKKWRGREGGNHITGEGDATW